MAHKISTDCISCGSCADTCPVSAISEGDTQYVIDAGICIDCGACADACPVEAIRPE
ncbi:MAG: 4Fe-4S binding protein [Clostridiales bacterium]|jgi:ferredoxin|nr:4Fe-4S binding protein [Clostridiales bacterium]